MIRIARNAATVVLLALLVVTQVGLRRTERLDPIKMRPEVGLGFLYPIDVAHSDLEGNASTLELRENDRPLGPAHSYHEDIRNLGHGRFSHWGKVVYFSTSDGSDPRVNHRTYTIRHDTEPSPLLGFGLLFALVALESRRIARGLGKLGEIHPAWPTLAIGAGALIFRVWVLAHHRFDSLGHMVKGVPVSDGVWWDTMADIFGRGDRGSPMWDYTFSALRPFAWIFRGAIYALTGPSVLVAQVVHVILGALSAALAFETLRRLAPLPVALLGSAVLAFSLIDARYALTPASEPLGAFLATLTLFLFVLAAQSWKRPLWLLAGVVLGLAVLTRPEVMPALLALPAALALLLTRRNAHRPAAKRLAIATLLFAAGFAVTLGPWLIRQRVKFNTWQISGNSAEVLFGASSPEYGTWGPGVDALGRGKTLRERIAYFSARQQESVRKNWRFWIRNSAHYAMVATKRLVSRTPLLVALLFLIPGALGPAPDVRRIARVLVAAAAVGILLWRVPEAHLYWIWLVALAAALVLRAPMLLIGAAVVSPIVALGMTALSGNERLTYALEWLATALSIWLIAIVIGHPVRAPAAPATWGRGGLIARRIAAVSVALFALGLGKAAVSFARTPVSHLPAVLSEADARPYIDRALEAPSQQPYASLRPQLEVRTIWPRADYVMHFAAGEAVGHWNPLLKNARSYAFDVLQPQQESYYVMPQGMQPRLGQRLVVVGVWVQRPLLGTSFEIIAATTPDGRLFLPDAAVAPLHARDMSALHL